jgi:bloom syndrome protein
MSPNWNLKSQLEWIKNSKPYIPQIDLNIPDLTDEQKLQFNLIRASSFPNNTQQSPLTNDIQNNSTNESAFATENNSNKRSNTTSNSNPSFTQKTLPLRHSSQVNIQGKSSLNLSPNSNTNSNPSLSTKTATPVRGQIQITQLMQKKSNVSKNFQILTSQSNAEFATDIIIDLTQDEMNENNILPEKKKSINEMKKKSSSFDDTDDFSDDDEQIEAMLARCDNVGDSKISEKSKKMNLSTSSVSKTNTSIQDMKNLCEKQHELIENLTSLIEFLESGLKTETSTSLSEDFKRNERKKFNPKLNELKSQCNLLQNNLPKLDLSKINVNETIFKNIAQIKEVNKSTSMEFLSAVISTPIPIATSTTTTNTTTINTNLTSNIFDGLKNKSIPLTPDDNKENNPQKLDNSVELVIDDAIDDGEEDADLENSNIEADDTAIIFQNQRPTVSNQSNQINTHVPLLSSPSISSTKNDINRENDEIINQRLKRTLKSKPAATVPWSTQEDDIEDSFNCESEEESATKTQIRREMGNFVVSDDDHSSVDASYKDDWKSDNEIEEIEDIDQSECIQLDNSAIEEIEDDSQKINNLEGISDSERLIYSDALEYLPNHKKPICISDGISELEIVNKSDDELTNGTTEKINDNADANGKIDGNAGEEDDDDDDWLINKNAFNNNKSKPLYNLGIDNHILENQDEDFDGLDDEEEDDDIMVIGDRDDYFTQLNEERGIDNIHNVDDDLDDDFPWDDLEVFKKPKPTVFREEHDDITELNNPVKENYKQFHGKHEWTSEIYKALKNTFKLQSFRENQLNAINATLSGDDVFVLMPTGGGKSLCYQLPAIINSGVTSGVTVVISPLISLMEDQISHLNAKNIHATMLNSKMSADERRHAFNLFIGGMLSLMYLSPEMISKSGQCRRAISKLYKDSKLARIVIDEAHCVSSWGHDFRPDYKELKFFKSEYPDIPIMALTATANEIVRADIIEHLGLRNPKFYKQSFNRTNLFYEVLPKDKAVMENIVSLINNKYSGLTGIIYCHSKNLCETTAQRLSEFGIACEYYHAGMETSARSKIQKEWQEGKVKVIAATIAFGMGIDKGDVRFVIHLTIPRNLEGYYQETGRAGRDGKHSDCIMFYSMKDVRTIQSLIKKDRDIDQHSKEHHLDKLQQVVQYCENFTECRRQIVLQYFNEKFERKDCNKQCDNCVNYANTEIQLKDMTELAKSCVGLVKKAQSSKVTCSLCQDIIKGSKYAKILKGGYEKLEQHGSGSGLNKVEIERVFFHLIRDGYLEEKPVVTGRGFSTNYIFLGLNANKLLNGNAKVVIEEVKRKKVIKDNNPISLSRQASFRPSSELWNTNTRSMNSSNGTVPRVFNSNGNKVYLRNKGVTTDVLVLNDPIKKRHLDDCYMELRKTRSRMATMLELSKEVTLGSDTMFKSMSLLLPITLADYSKLDDFKPEQGEYFNRFRKTITELRNKRMMLFNTLDLTRSQQNTYSETQDSGLLDITEDSATMMTSHNSKSKFFKKRNNNKNKRKSGNQEHKNKRVKKNTGILKNGGYSSAMRL